MSVSLDDVCIIRCLSLLTEVECDITKLYFLSSRLLLSCWLPKVEQDKIRLPENNVITSGFYKGSFCPMFRFLCNVLQTAFCPSWQWFIRLMSFYSSFCTILLIIKFSLFLLKWLTKFPHKFCFLCSRVSLSMVSFVERLVANDLKGNK